MDQDHRDRLVDVDTGAGNQVGRRVAVLSSDMQLVDRGEQFRIADGAEVVGAGHQEAALLDEVVDRARDTGLDGLVVVGLPGS